MGLVSATKTFKVLTALVTCLLAVAVVLCLVHPGSFGESHGAEHGHQHTSSSSSPHSAFDGHCLLATIPPTIILVWFARSVLYLSVQRLHPLAPSFPPFIPPKAMTRS